MQQQPAEQPVLTVILNANVIPVVRVATVIQMLLQLPFVHAEDKFQVRIIQVIYTLWVTVGINTYQQELQMT